MEDRWVTYKEAARILKITRQGVWAAVKRHNLPVRKERMEVVERKVYKKDLVNLSELLKAMGKDDNDEK